MSRFTRYAWFVVAYNLLVVLWGAFVRVTGSGAGCGSHWPLCNGEVLPRSPSTETLIELSHRITSGIDGFLVLGLLIAAFRLFPKGHRVRWAAGASMVFLVAEALVGAGLVRFDGVRFVRWTANDGPASSEDLGVSSLLPARDGSLWLGFYSGGIGHLNGATRRARRRSSAGSERVGLPLHLLPRQRRRRVALSLERRRLQMDRGARQVLEAARWAERLDARPQPRTRAGWHL